jgi:hypothetical protein
MLYGWQFAVLVLAYFVLLACALSFGAAANGDRPTAVLLPLDELASRRSQREAVLRDGVHSRPLTRSASARSSLSVPMAIKRSSASILVSGDGFVRSSPCRSRTASTSAPVRSRI